MTGETDSTVVGEIRIRAEDKWVILDAGALWAHRDLLLLLVRRDWITRYSQTVLGPIWFLIQPLLTTLVFVLVFTKVAKISTGEKPPMLFYLCGMIPWNYFAQTFSSSSSVLTANVALFGKVYFPRLVVPLAGVVSNALMMLIQFCLFVVVWLVYYFLEGAVSVPPLGGLFLLPLAVLQVAALALGAGLLMAAITARYRDLSHLSAFLVNLWFYVTPVIFPISSVPSHLKWALMLNPLTFALEAFRYSLLGVGVVDLPMIVTTTCATALILFLGMVAFQRVQGSFVDTV